MLIPALLLAVSLLEVPVVRLILRTGASIPVAGEIRSENEKLIFRTPAGVLYSIPLEEVDLEKTISQGTTELKAVRLDQPSVSGQKAPRKPAAARKLALSEEERKRLLEELSHNREGTPAPVQESLTPEGLEKALAENEKERAEREAQAESWRQLGRSARGAIEQATGELRALEDEQERLEEEVNQLVTQDLDPTGQLLQLDSVRSQITRAREAIVNAESAWVKLQDEARKAGALPGWLRD